MWYLLWCSIALFLIHLLCSMLNILSIFLSEYSEVFYLSETDFLNSSKVPTHTQRSIQEICTGTFQEILAPLQISLWSFSTHAILLFYDFLLWIAVPCECMGLFSADESSTSKERVVLSALTCQAWNSSVPAAGQWEPRWGGGWMLHTWATLWGYKRQACTLAEASHAAGCHIPSMAWVLCAVPTDWFT